MWPAPALPVVAPVVAQTAAVPLAATESTPPPAACDAAAMDGLLLLSACAGVQRPGSSAGVRSASSDASSVAGHNSLYSFSTAGSAAGEHTESTLSRTGGSSNDGGSNDGGSDQASDCEGKQRAAHLVVSRQPSSSSCGDPATEATASFASSYGEHRAAKAAVGLTTGLTTGQAVGLTTGQAVAAAAGVPYSSALNIGLNSMAQ